MGGKGNKGDDGERRLQELHGRFQSLNSRNDRRAKLRRFARTFKRFLGGLLIAVLFLGFWWWMAFGFKFR